MNQLYSETELHSYFQTLASSILTAHPDKAIVLVGILSAGYPIAKRLNTLLKLDTPAGKLDVSLFRDDLRPKSDFVTIQESDIPFSIDDKTVILVDDVIHHGRTASAALQALGEFGRPSCIELAVLFDRGQRELPIQPNHTAHAISNHPDTEKISISLYETDGEDAVLSVPIS